MTREAVEDHFKKDGTKSNRSRFNLLNPINLLARRRSSQTQVEKEQNVPLNVQTGPLPAVPADFDPSIRGKIVHDFSIPRNRRLHSYNEYSSTESSPATESQISPRDLRRPSDLPGLYSPTRSSASPKLATTFTEHFEEDGRTLQPENTGYLQKFAESQQGAENLDKNNVPSFAKDLPTNAPEQETKSLSSNGTLAVPVDSVRNARRLSPLATLSMREAARKRSTSPQQPPPVTVIQDVPIPIRAPPSPPSLELPHLKDVRLPKHMNSSASRFSFQLADVSSAAQEKLLEEKHSQQQALKKSGLSAARGVDEELADSDDDPDYADYDFEAETDNLEEAILGVNADIVDEIDFEERIPGINAESDSEYEIEDDALGNIKEQPMCMPTANMESDSYSEHTESAPATLKDVPTDLVLEPPSRTDLPEDSMPLLHLDRHQSLYSWDGLGIVIDDATSDTKAVDAQIANATQRSQQEMPSHLSVVPGLLTDDDMYFDDGAFDDIEVTSEHSDFDEAIFDDETGKIRDIPAQNARNYVASRQRTFSEDELQPDASNGIKRLPNDLIQQRRLSPTSVNPALAPIVTAVESTQISLPPQASVTSDKTGLTESNLAAFDDALVIAAHTIQTRPNAEIQMSAALDEDLLRSLREDSQPGLVSDDSHLSHNFESNAYEDDTDDFNYDDDFDDPMIAEANAEALENDDEGFYGQEFGFYAKAVGRNGTQAVNGGYFGPKGYEGVHRNRSVKANYPEPALTPITERSEWSARNSVASLQLPMFPTSAQSMPSPALAQLLDADNQGFDDDVSMSALMRLRRGWGGSQTSLHSASGSIPGSSPLVQVASRDFAQLQPALEHGHHASHSIHSLADSLPIHESEEEHDDEDMPSPSPTKTQNTPKKKSMNPAPATPFQDVALSPSSFASEKGHKRGHSRTSSGAESVSYMRDPEGSGRWLLERRRTGDNGELEVIAREYLVGATI